MNGNRIIVHVLIKNGDKYLVIKRSPNETTYPNYWDIPGGLAEVGELPKNAAIREVKEEVGLDIIPTKTIHEDSNYDKKKDMIFVRLVYLSEYLGKLDSIKLDISEHTEYRWVSSLYELENELVAPFLEEVFEEM